MFMEMKLTGEDTYKIVRNHIHILEDKVVVKITPKILHAVNKIKVPKGSGDQTPQVQQAWGCPLSLQFLGHIKNSPHDLV